MANTPDILTRMNRAIDYIEAHLTDEIDLETAARLAYTSSFNFQRMFSFMTDVTLSEYIRRRRLSQAAILLRSSGFRVIDVAILYGYDSPVSFARAFQAMHGLSPSAARAAKVTLKAYPRISFQITIKGVDAMNFRMEQHEPFQIFGIEGVFDNDEQKQGNHTPHMLWTRSHENGHYDRLRNAAGPPPDFIPPNMCQVHGFCGYRETGLGTFPYMLGAFRGPESRIDGFVLYEIPAYTWVILPSIRYDWKDFDSVIEALYKRFFTEWLPASEYEQIPGLDFELYGGDEQQGYIELWFAVQKRV